MKQNGSELEIKKVNGIIGDIREKRKKNCNGALEMSDYRLDTFIKNVWTN